MPNSQTLKACRKAQVPLKPPQRGATTGSHHMPELRPTIATTSDHLAKQALIILKRPRARQRAACAPRNTSREPGGQHRCRQEASSSLQQITSK
eukprot:10893662-Alexandrium_andersonii.AAC.1